MTENITTLLTQQPNQLGNNSPSVRREPSNLESRVRTNNEVSNGLNNQVEDLNGQEENTAFSFSLQGAIASLEQSAAQSLNTHGATPQNNALTQNQQNDGAHQTRVRENNNSQQSQNLPNTIQPLNQSLARTTIEQISNSQAAQNTHFSEARGNNTQQSVNPALALALNPTANSISNAAAIRSNTAPRTPINAPQQITQNLAELPAKLSSTQSRNPQAQPPTPTSSNQDTQNFTNILSSKFLSAKLQGGQTQFDVRLDPPELGRVEIKLVASEKNINSLTLSFEHQSTLDYFRQDQESLKTTLQEAGFDADGHSINFELSQTDHSLDGETLGDNAQNRNTQDHPLQNQEQNLSANFISAETNILIDTIGAQHNFRTFSALSPVSQNLIDIHL